MEGEIIMRKAYYFRMLEKTLLTTHPITLSERETSENLHFLKSIVTGLLGFQFKKRTTDVAPANDIPILANNFDLIWDTMCHIDAGIKAERKAYEAFLLGTELLNHEHMKMLGTQAYGGYSDAQKTFVGAFLVQLLRDRFTELANSKQNTNQQVTETPKEAPTKTNLPPNKEKPFPRYRDVDQQIDVDKFPKDIPQNHFLRSSIQIIFDEGGMSSDTANKLLNAGLKKGEDLFNAHPDWLMTLIGKEDWEMLQKTFNSFSLEQSEAKISRYREEVKDCKIEDFAIDSAKHNVLSASVSKLSTDGMISKVTPQKLVDQGITTGMALFKTNPQWLMGYLVEEELQQIHDLFFGAHLNWPLSKKTDEQNNLTKEQKEFLATKIDANNISVRVRSCIMGYNSGKARSEQYVTMQDLYQVSQKEFLGMRNMGKKQIIEISEIFSEKGLTWPRPESENK